MLCKSSPDSFLSSSSFEDDSKSDDDNTDNELAELSDEEMEKEMKEDFDRFD